MGNLSLPLHRQPRCDGRIVKDASSRLGPATVQGERTAVSNIGSSSQRYRHTDGRLADCRETSSPRPH